MFNKLDLFEQNWIDTVFAGRNKAYGAYDLRRRDAAITVKSTIIGAIIFSLLISMPLIVKRISETIGSSRTTIDEKITLVDLTQLPPPPKQENPVVPPPPPVAEMKSLQEIKKFVPPVVAPEEEITEVLATQDELKTKRSGSQDVKASDDGEIVLDKKAVDHDVLKVVDGGDGIETVETVQIMPSYPGGLKKFVEYIMNHMHGIQLVDVTELSMKFRFVIEKDGTLSDIETVSDGGYPAIAEKAKQVLAKSPKWKPGINNGKPVRVSYMVPIVVKMGQ